MLAGHQFTVVDLASVDHPAFRRKDWTLIRGQFDAVVCVDVLEHIPETDRSSFLAHLAEMGRILVLACPFRSDEVGEAEYVLHGLFSVLYPGGNLFLNQHLTNGLPLLYDTLGILHSFFPHVHVFNGQSVDLWLTSTAMFCLAEEAPAGKALAVRYACEVNSGHHMDGNPYRHFVVCSPTEIPPTICDRSDTSLQAWDRAFSSVRSLIPLASLIHLTGSWNPHSIADKMQQVDRLKAALGRLVEENQRTSQAYEDTVKENARVSRAYEDLVQLNERTSQAYEDTVKENARVSRAYEDLVQLNERTSQAYEDTVKENARVSRAYEDLVQLNERTSQAYEDTVKENNYLTQQYAEITARYEQRIGAAIRGVKQWILRK